MDCQQRSCNTTYELNASSFCDDSELFDVDKRQDDNSTDSMSPALEDSDLFDLDFDIDEQIPLYGGNVHPPEYYRQGIEKPDQRDRYARYAPKTRVRLVEVENQWWQYVTYIQSLTRINNNHRFCIEVGLGNPWKVFESISIPTLEKFLEWIICQKVGKNGRKKRGTKTSSSLNTRWKNLQIVYKQVMGEKFKAQIYDGMVEVYYPSP